MTKYNPKADDKLTTLYPPCFYCTQLQHIGTQSLESWTCNAFPAEIPYGILARHLRHDEPSPGQEGDAVFESKEFDEDGPDGPGPYVISFDGVWKQKRNGGFVAYVIVHSDSVQVSLPALDKDRGIIGDFFQELSENSPPLFGISYFQWRKLGDGMHVIAVPLET